ncbi:LysR family transcriptional regulator [Chitinilyticum piscinae]|uniref:LysR family transcriptional regulator n=1 Tax=Chitinilyticum piscinae TaxID=2866724 RepID=A0A8J7FZ44_9NEIS|nr:LysR family transcriptional regulator [Chitinilyticum piscinae]MBE9608348.1 LysR family transcriptional regulator [Chitinilyticum piscinae]
MRTNTPPEALLAFEALVRLGSFTAAAQERGCAKSHVSQQLRLLEQQLGTVLLLRTTRRMTLTEAGHRLLPHAVAMRELLEQVRLDAEEAQESLEGSLRISTTPSLAQYVLSSLLAEFLQQHPGLQLRLDALNRLQDPLLEGLDFCLRARTVGDDRLVAHPAGFSMERLYASVSYLAQHPPLTRPQDLAQHHVLINDDFQYNRLWTLYRGEEEITVPLTAQLCSDNNPTLAMAAIAGHGICQLPHFVGERYRQLGLLQPVLPDWHGHFSPIYLVHPFRQPLPRKYRVFIDELLPRLRAALYQPEHPDIALSPATAVRRPGV